MFSGVLSVSIMGGKGRGGCGSVFIAEEVHVGVNKGTRTYHHGGCRKLRRTSREMLVFLNRLGMNISGVMASGLKEMYCIKQHGTI